MTLVTTNCNTPVLTKRKKERLYICSFTSFSFSQVCSFKEIKMMNESVNVVTSLTCDLH